MQVWNDVICGEYGYIYERMLHVCRQTLNHLCYLLKKGTKTPCSQYTKHFKQYTFVMNVWMRYYRKYV